MVGGPPRESQEENVHVSAQEAELLFREEIPQIPKVQNPHSLQLEAIDGVLVRALFVRQTLHGRQCLEHHAHSFHRAGACYLQGVQDPGISRDH